VKQSPSPQPKKPNIRQVAEASGVSLMTASRALSGRGSVAEETKQRVLAAARELKYRPNRLVRAVMGGRSGMVGVMVPLGSWFLAQVVRGLHDELAAHKYLPVVHFHGDGPGANRDDKELEYLHRLIDVQHVGDSTHVRTKGDQNPLVDPWTLQVTSTTAPVAIGSIPYLGWTTNVLRGTLIRLLFAGFVMILVVIGMIRLRRQMLRSRQDDVDDTPS
jgi:hypothetical protein